MDCRHCNWSICRECHPPACQEEEDSSVWGAFSLLVDAATREMAGVATEVETFVSGLKGQLSDAKEKMSCQPASKSQLALEEVEIWPLAAQQPWDDQEDNTDNDARRTVGDEHPRAIQRRRRQRSATPLRASNSDEAASGEEEQPSKPVKLPEPADLIDLGVTDLLHEVPGASAPSPAGCATQPGPPDLLDLPGCAPKLEDPAGQAAGSVRQPALLVAQLGA